MNLPILLEGLVEIVTDQEELQRINTAYAEKYVAPRTGARATIFEEHTDLYSVHVKHAMTWEYGIVATRTDWRF